MSNANYFGGKNYFLAGCYIFGGFISLMAACYFQSKKAIIKQKSPMASDKANPKMA